MSVIVLPHTPVSGQVVPSVGQLGNFVAIRDAFNNTAVQTDVAKTIAVAHTWAADILFTDALYDIGKSGATRPRDLFLSRNIVVGGTAAITGAVTLSSTLAVTGAATLSAVGSHGIGGAGSAVIQLYLRGTLAGGTVGHYVATRLQPAAGNSARLMEVEGTLDIAGSGTHADFASAILMPPTITAGAGAVTNASTLKITAAPTGGTKNYALWVDDGTVRIDGRSASAVGAANGRLPIEVDGTTYYLALYNA